MAKKQQQRKSRRGRGRKASGAGTGFGSSGPMCICPAPGRKAYHFERRIAPSPLAISAADTGRTFNYTLGSFPGATEFTALFDLYRMTSLEITFAANLIAGNQYLPVLYMLADYDSYTTPLTIDVVMQRPHKRVVLTTMQPSFTFKLKPRVLGVVATSSGSSSSALVPSSQWMDVNDTTIIYGGLLGWVENYNTGTASSVIVTVRGFFDFAMVR